MAGRGVCLALACALAALAGCYSPSVEPCIYACGNNQACPNGLSCNNQGMCAASATAQCGGANPDAKLDSTVDAMLDAMVDAADTTAPETFIDSAPPALDNNMTATFTFHSSEAGSHFECLSDAGSFTSCTSPKLVTGLTNGMHTFEVRAIDAAGNTDQTSAKHAWTFDDNMPQTLLDSHPPLDANVTSATFAFHCVKTTDTPECQLDGAAFGACMSNTSHMVSGLADAMHTFTVRCKAPGGGTDPSPETFTWTVDTLAPTTMITSKPPDPTNTSMPVFMFLAQAGSTFVCSIDAAAFAACTSGQTFSTSGDGSHMFRVRATDPAGNMETSPVSYTWTLDTMPPTSAFTGTPNAVSKWDFAMFAFTSEANATFDCALDAGSFMPCSSGLTLMNLTEGVHNFYVRAKDLAGNMETSPQRHMWRVDLTDPVISFNAPTPAQNSTVGPVVGFDWTVSEAVASTSCTFDGVTVPGCATGLDVNLPHGLGHVFAVTVTDFAGRTTTKSVMFNVDCKISNANPGPGTIGIFHFDEIGGDQLMNTFGGTNGFNGGALGPDPADAQRVNTSRYPAGRALSFTDSAHDTARYPTGFGVKQNSLTFELWVQPNLGNAVNYNLMSSADNRARLYIQPSLSTITMAWRIENNVGLAFETTATLTPSAWNHVLGTYDGATNTARLYVNGGQQTPVTTTGTVNFDVGSITWGSNGTEHLTGIIDEPYVSLAPYSTGDYRLHWCPLQFP